LFKSNNLGTAGFFAFRIDFGAVGVGVGFKVIGVVIIGTGSR
jgi:hypothetical protein